MKKIGCVDQFDFYLPKTRFPKLTNCAARNQEAV